MKIQIKTALPGPKSTRFLDRIKHLNGGWSTPYPFVHSRGGKGCYFQDIDGNTFLDFASQIASNPLGYNHPNILATIKQYTSRSPIKFAGQDFVVQEHVALLEELLSITPKHLNAAFLINSGAEAVENALKICMRKKPTAKYGISFDNGFHGRTLGALSCTNSKIIQKKNYFSLLMRRLPFTAEAPDVLQNILHHDIAPEEIAFIIVEHVQGEGGYRIADKRMIQEVRAIAQECHIPYIADEVQSGMGRTGQWWAFQHYGIQPDVFSTAKALQVGATVANKSFFPSEAGSISSTWGGGHTLDLAVGVATIQTIKKEKLLHHAEKMGKYVQQQMTRLADLHAEILYPRGLGLMRAFDLPTKKMRDDVVIAALQEGLVILGCGERSIRLIPPLIVKEKEIDAAVAIIERVIKQCSTSTFQHTGKICQYSDCGTQST